MQTKFDIGDEVFLVCKVEYMEINNRNGVLCRVKLSNEDGGYTFNIWENRLILKKKGNSKDGNEVR